MPFYEYECQACKFYTEVMQKISDAPLLKCPSCGRRTLKKLVSAPVFRLKGSGWYETDFKSEKENKRNLVAGDKDDSGAAKGESKAPAQSESKPETQPAQKTEARSDGAKATQAAGANAAGSSAGASGGGRKRASVNRAGARRPAAKSRARRRRKG